MANQNDANMAEALTDLIRETLTVGGKITIPGLGTFGIRHEPSQISSAPGRVLVHPPRDVVEFTSDSHPGE